MHETERVEAEHVQWQLELAEYQLEDAQSRLEAAEARLTYDQSASLSSRNLDAEGLAPRSRRPFAE
jgi:hypothetical protein